MLESVLPKNNVVLLGVGHTNAYVLRQWRMHPIPNARLTCISNFPVVTYSGMLPGVLSGQYPPERMQIDLVRLCAAARARLVVDEVVALDLSSAEILFKDRSPIPFDLLSIGIGSVPDFSGTSVMPSAVVPIKPMQTFLDRLRDRLDGLRPVAADRVLQITVVGAGAGGTEIAFCLPNFVQQVLPDSSIKLTLVDSNDRVIRGTSTRTASVVRQELESKGVRVLLDRHVDAVASGEVRLSNGESFATDLVLWATRAAAPPLLSDLGLPRDDRGFLLTKPSLQTAGDERIFAVGDTGAIVNQPLPKAGVYAVRQSPILWENIQRCLAGQPLRSYVPQRSFLKLFNTADGRAIGEYRGVTLRGRWCWKLKDRIDGRFMDMYQQYDPMPMAPVRPAAQQEPVPRCLGCGGKVGSSILSNALSRLEIPSSERVLMGIEAADDVAVIQPTNRPLALSVDFFAAPLDDPFLVGRLAAINATSDLYASGAQPRIALAMVTIPEGEPREQERLLYDVLAGSLHEFRKMEISLVGGHTMEGPQLSIGFTILGDQQRSEPHRKSGLQPGDVLVLTKPLGTGVLLAAHMRAKCKASWMQGMLGVMLQSNKTAAEIANAFDISGLTDVTGFGLAGHLLEMLRASEVRAEIVLDQIPFLEGAVELLASGLESTLAPANRAAESQMQVMESLRQSPEYAALFDPQTCGGLLMGISEDHAPKLLERLRHQSDINAVAIGRVKEKSTTAQLAVY